MKNYETTVRAAEKRWGKNWDIDYPTFPRVVNGNRKDYYKRLINAGMAPERAKEEAGQTVLYIPRR